MKQPRVSIVILNWNCLKYLKHCIDSVIQQTYKNIELIVMDNASTDGSVEFIKKEFPEIRIIENHKNLGFGKAHNQGIKLTKGAYYMPLNPDVILTKTYVEEMVKAITLRDNIGRVQGKLYYMENGNKFTNRIYTTGHKIYKNGVVSHYGTGEEDNGQFNEIREIFGANGAAPLYKRVMLEDIKINPEEYYDELFFIYGDDIDLDWRAQIKGWKCLYTPQAIAYHRGGGSKGIKTSYIRAQYIRNKYIMCLKNAFLFDLIYYIIPRIIKEMNSTILKKDKKVFYIWCSILVHLLEILKKRYKTLCKRRVARKEIRKLFLPVKPK